MGRRPPAAAAVAAVAVAVAPIGPPESWGAQGCSFAELATGSLRAQRCEDARLSGSEARVLSLRAPSTFQRIREALCARPFRPRRG